MVRPAPGRPQTFDHQAIEAKWQARWEAERLYEADIDPSSSRSKITASATALPNDIASVNLNCGPPLEAELNQPHGVYVHPTTGDLYIADSSNNRVLKIDRTP